MVPGRLTRGLLSSAPRTWITPGCGGSTLPHPGPTQEPEECVDSIRLRVGCAVPLSLWPSLSASLASSTRALLTPLVVEATRGLNAVTALIHAAAQSCDHTAEMEVPGLIHVTDLRLGDVLTSAVGNACTALDISTCLLGVRAQIAPAPGSPLSCTSMAHPSPSKRSLSESIPRKRNFVSAEVLYQRLHSSITLEIWKRRPGRFAPPCAPGS